MSYQLSAISYQPSGRPFGTCAAVHRSAATQRACARFQRKQTELNGFSLVRKQSVLVPLVSVPIRVTNSKPVAPHAILRARGTLDS
jgi:hypothetical protein